MPPIAVRDIDIQRRENDLVLATFGRGFFVLDDYSPLRLASREVLEKEATLFPVRRAWMYVPARLPWASRRSRTSGTPSSPRRTRPSARSSPTT